MYESVASMHSHYNIELATIAVDTLQSVLRAGQGFVDPLGAGAADVSENK